MKQETRNYFLLIDDEVYLYPPEAYNNSFVYSVQSLFGCQNKPFPSCLHNEIIEKYKNKSLVENWSNFGYMSPAIIPLITNYEEVLNAVCMIISFEKKFDIVNFTYNPLVCVDVNLSHVFSYDYFQEKDAFSFIFFSIGQDSKGQRTFVPIFTNKQGAYEERIFNKCYEKI